MLENKEISKSGNAIAKVAKTLFWKHGIRRVSVTEICKEAGVSKMTFYRNFKNKNEVAEYVLREVMEHGMSQYEEIMNQEIDFPAKIVKLIISQREESKDISQEFLKDINQSEDNDLKKIIEKYQQKSYQNVMQDLKKAQKEGWIRKDIKLSFLLHILEDLDKKVMDEELLSMYEKPEDLIMELTNFFFYGIIETNA